MEILQEIAHKIGFEWHLAVTHLINILIIFFILAKFAFPTLKKTIAERKAKIEAGILNYENSKSILADAETEVKKLKVKQAAERDALLETAEKEGRKIVEEARYESSQIVLNAQNLEKQAGEKGKKEAQAEILKNLPNLLSAVSKNAFSGKLTAEVNNDFLKNLLK